MSDQLNCDERLVERVLFNDACRLFNAQHADQNRHWPSCRSADRPTSDGRESTLPRELRRDFSFRVNQRTNNAQHETIALTSIKNDNPERNQRRTRTSRSTSDERRRRRSNRCCRGRVSRVCVLSPCRRCFLFERISVRLTSSEKRHADEQHVRETIDLKQAETLTFIDEQYRVILLDRR
jgi:hypothetical protein